MSRYTPRQVSRYAPGQVSRLWRGMSVYQRIIEADTAIRYAAQHPPLTYALAKVVADELDIVGFYLPLLNGPRSARVGGRRAATRAARTGARLLREWAAA